MSEGGEEIVGYYFTSRNWISRKGVESIEMGSGL